MAAKIGVTSKIMASETGLGEAAKGSVRVKIVVRKQDLKQMLEAMATATSTLSSSSSSSPSGGKNSNVHHLLQTLKASSASTSSVPPTAPAPARPAAVVGASSSVEKRLRELVIRFRQKRLAKQSVGVTNKSAVRCRDQSWRPALQSIPEDCNSVF